MSIYDYSTTAGSNTTVGGNSIAEGAAAGLVNNAIRGFVAEITEWRKDFGGDLTSGGTANAQTITTNGTIGALADGLMIAFEAGAALTNTTTTATLNVDSLGAKKMRRLGDTALLAGDITAGNFYMAMYDASADSASGGWIILNPSKAPNDGELAHLAGTETFTGQKRFNSNVLFNTANGNPAVLNELNTMGWVPGTGTLQISSDDQALGLNRRNNGVITNFRRAGSIVGSIDVDASSTTYNTSSDARFKTGRVPLADAKDVGAIIDALVVNEYTDTRDGKRRVGPDAQQVREVIPDIVSEGEGGDLTYEKAGPVPYLVAEVQMLRSRVADLEARMAALEAR